MRSRVLPLGLWLLPLVVVAGAACREAPSNGALATPANAMQAGDLAARARSSTLDSSRRTAIVDAVARVAPSVVSIRVEARREVPQAPGLFDFFFIPRPRERVLESFGTGFVFGADGLILTNQHVVAGAQSVTVSLADGTELEARILGEDPTTDIAVLRVDRTGLPVAPLGRSTDLMVGEWVVALGNPYAYLLGDTEPTVTAGVVSATGRNILPGADQAGLYLDMIQTDAPINPGNSGGPLANALGEVVGVNSSIFTRSGESVGLGFAIPIERALRMAEEIVRTGAVRRAWTGLEVAGAAAMRDWKRQGGVRVTRVEAGGPADRAGIAEGDILIEAEGRPLRNFLDWESVKLGLRVGQPVSVRVRQGGRVTTRRLMTADLPSVTAERVSVLRGLELITVTPGVATERGLRAERGALVLGITPEIARQTGLRTGDVIIGVDRNQVTSAQQFATLLERIRPRQTFRLYFERDGQVGFTDLWFQ
jgi:serine protease Do